MPTTLGGIYVQISPLTCRRCAVAGLPREVERADADLARAAVRARLRLPLYQLSEAVRRPKPGAAQDGRTRRQLPAAGRSLPGWLARPIQPGGHTLLVPGLVAAPPRCGLCHNPPG